MALQDEQCKQVQRGEAPMTIEQAHELLPQVPQWRLQGQALVREFTCADFRAAMRFVNRLAELAEAQQHHPDMCISYNKVVLTLATHKIGGLSRNDFILAAKIDRMEE